MSTPVSGDWAMFSNGFPVDLFIQDTDDPTVLLVNVAENNVTDTGKGSWDNALQEIKFRRTLTAPDANHEVQDYIGFLFDRTVNIPSSGFVDTLVMAGTFTASGGFGNPVKQAVGFGWFAFFRGPGP